MPIYPENIGQTIRRPRHAGTLDAPTATGRAVNLDCGCVAELELVENEGLISDVRFKTNGCGYMVAAAEAAAAGLEGQALSSMYFPDENQLRAQLFSDETANERGNCVSTVLTAVRLAFANLREKRVQEFTGGSPLICSCFGVDEATIEESIRTSGLRTVNEVTSATRAGGGCGSCLLLISEILDSETTGPDML